MKSGRVLIKLGGASLQDDKIFEEVTNAIKEYLSFDYQVALVHGGGPAINTELTKRGIKWEFVQGQRVTTNEMMDVIEMVLSGSVNKKLVRFMNSKGLNAVGFSGVDRNTLMCRQSAPELGLVGLVEKVESQWLNNFVKPDQDTVPVIAPIGCGANGETYNVNADWAASSLAASLDVNYLVFLTDQDGILDGEKNVVPYVTELSLQTMLEDGTVTGGMATKVRAILNALQNGVHSVRVLNAKSAIDGLWSDYVGTWCVRDSDARTMFHTGDRYGYAFP